MKTAYKQRRLRDADAKNAFEDQQRQAKEAKEDTRRALAVYREKMRLERFTEAELAANESNRLMREALLQYQSTRPSEAKKILGEVAARFGFTAADILSEMRTKELCFARHTAMLEVLEATRWTYSRLGRFFHRDHSTCMHGVSKMRRLQIKALATT
jgi:chromosomal replication initiation ATPase DnaA